MTEYTFVVTFVLGYWLGLIVGRSAYPTRSLARGGNIGTSPLILNEGRTIRGNGVDGPYQPRPADAVSLGVPSVLCHRSVSASGEVLARWGK